MKKSIPFGKERNDFSLFVFDDKVNKPFVIKQCLMKKSIPFGKERDDFSLSINSI